MQKFVRIHVLLHLEFLEFMNPLCTQHNKRVHFGSSLLIALEDFFQIPMNINEQNDNIFNKCNAYVCTRSTAEGIVFKNIY